MRTYNYLYIVLVSVFSTWAVIDGLSSSLDYLNYKKSFVFTVFILMFYLLLYWVSKVDFEKNNRKLKYKGTSSIVKVATIGSILGLWLPVTINFFDPEIEVKPNSVTIKKVFSEFDERNLNVLFLPFKSDGDCIDRIGKYEEFLKNDLNNFAVSNSHSIGFEVLSCYFPDSFGIFNYDELNDYPKGEVDVIKIYETGLYHNADLVVAGSQKFLSNDSVEVAFELYTIDPEYFESYLWSSSNRNSDGLSRTYDVGFIGEYLKFKGIKDYQSSFLSTRPLIRIPYKFKDIREISGFGSNYSFSENSSLSFRRLFIVKSLEKQMNFGNYYLARNIYTRAVNHPLSLELSIQGNWFLVDLMDQMDDLGKQDSLKDYNNLINGFDLVGTNTILELNMYLKKIKIAYDRSGFSHARRTLGSIQKEKTKGLYNSIGFAVASYFLLELSQGDEINSGIIHTTIKAAEESIKSVTQQDKDIIIDTYSLAKYEFNADNKDQRERLYNLENFLSVIAFDQKKLKELNLYYLSQ